MRMNIPNFEEIGLTVDWYLNKLYDGSSRILFIDDGLGEMEKYEKLSKQFASEMLFHYDRREGSLDALRDGIAKTKELARSINNRGGCQPG
jgi:hypothetical protein